MFIFYFVLKLNRQKKIIYNIIEFNKSDSVIYDGFTVIIDSRPLPTPTHFIGTLRSFSIYFT